MNEEQQAKAVSDSPRRKGKTLKSEAEKREMMSAERVTIDSKYHCQYCNETFLNYFKLKSHMTKHKDQMVRDVTDTTRDTNVNKCWLQVYKCIHGSCQETFRELNAFVSHVQTHESEAEYRCHLCPKVFSALLELGAHQYMHSMYPTHDGKKESRLEKSSSDMGNVIPLFNISSVSGSSSVSSVGVATQRRQH